MIDGKHMWRAVKSLEVIVRGLGEIAVCSSRGSPPSSYVMVGRLTERGICSPFSTGEGGGWDEQKYQKMFMHACLCVGD